MAPGLIERFIRSIEDLRAVFRSYHLLDEARKKEVRHQLYTRCGGFAKLLFKEVGATVEAEYQLLEEKLGHAPLIDNTSVNLQKELLEWAKDKMSKEDQVSMCKLVMDKLGQ